MLRLYFAFCLVFYTSTAFGAVKSYEITDTKEIFKLLSESSCFNEMMGGPPHVMKSALLVGWHIGKLIVTDEEDGSVYFMQERDTRDYHMKRSFKLFFYDSGTKVTKVLQTKACGVGEVGHEVDSPFYETEKKYEKEKSIWVGE